MDVLADLQDRAWARLVVADTSGLYLLRRFEICRACCLNEFDLERLRLCGSASTPNVAHQAGDSRPVRMRVVRRRK